LLQGKTSAEVNREIDGHVHFWYQLTVEHKPVREILDYNTLPEPVVDLWAMNAPYVAGRNDRFYHQISKTNLAESWGNLVGEPRVLTLWGSTDWHVTKAETTDWIVRTVNKASLGTATSAVVPDSDHFSNDVKSPEKSCRMLYGEPPRPPSTFKRSILTEVLKWCDVTVGRESL
tara:strand:- start:1830 stop:2351 length:522 start_codon:yes stop_codon:yes gene_type:complete